MACHAPRPAGVANGLRLLLALAQCGHLGTDAHGDPRAGAPTGRAGAHAQCGDCGQPDGQDQSKGGPRGFDAHKRVMGRKRHALVDTQGFLLKVVVSAASVQDRDGARLLARALRRDGPSYARLQRVWADAAYAGPLGEELRAQLGGEVEIVKRSDPPPQEPFVVPPHRWIIERSFGWWGGLRRLSKDYEYQVESSEALIYAGMTQLMLRRLARSPAISLPAG